jgi:polyphosphate kinase
VAPKDLREGLLERINAEATRALMGEPAWVKIKTNAIIDERTIDALYRASQAGVRVDVVSRGTCALRPGVPGLSENIRVRCILGRFLEHSRIFAFRAGGEPEVWIGSADLMHRNLDRRVEALVRIIEPSQVAALIENIDLAMSPHTAAFTLEPDGAWTRSKGSRGIGSRDLQAIYIARQPKRRATGR